MVNIFCQILFLKQKSKCITEDAFLELGLDSFKRESRGLFLFLNAVYCYRSIFISGSCETVLENGNMKMGTTGVQNKYFLDAEKHTICVTQFALEVEFTISLSTLGYFVSDSGI